MIIKSHYFTNKGYELPGVTNEAKFEETNWDDTIKSVVSEFNEKREIEKKEKEEKTKSETKEENPPSPKKPKLDDEEIGESSQINNDSVRGSFFFETIFF